MARREVLQVTCDRCGKNDLQDRAQVTDEPEVVVKFRGKETTFDDLCKTCRSAVEGYHDRILKKEKPKTAKDKKGPPPQEAPKRRSFLGGSK